MAREKELKLATTVAGTPLDRIKKMADEVVSLRQLENEEIKDTDTTDKCEVIKFHGWKRGVLSSSSVIIDAQMQLFELSQDRSLTLERVTPQSEFTSLLTRLPIFLPTIKIGAKTITQR